MALKPLRSRVHQAQSVGALLLGTARAFEAEATVVARPHVQQLLSRPAMMRVLPILERGPGRAGALAVQLGVTKQAMGQLLESMGRAGLVEFVTDRNDRRAREVRLTWLGSRCYREALTAMRKVERRLERQMGAHAFASLSGGLALAAATLSVEGETR